MKRVDKKRVEDMMDLVLDYKIVLDRCVDDETLSTLEREKARIKSLKCEKMLTELNEMEEDELTELLPIIKAVLKSIISTYFDIE